MKHPSSIPFRRTGFTLIELSIVLVIIGLIIGGVLVGQQMIRAAELRSVMDDADRFRAAVNTFIVKYNCIPGDCANATDIFGAADPDPTTCAQTVGAGTATCNGNGNGLIEIDFCPVEMYSFWKQLASAGLISGNYAGIDAFYIAGSGFADHCRSSITPPFQNSPGSRIRNAGWTVGVYPEPTNTSYKPKPPHWVHMFQFGYPIYFTSAPVLTGVDAYAIDSKFDDGNPSTGNVITTSVNYVDAPNCSTGDTAAATYNVGISGLICGLVINAEF